MATYRQDGNPDRRGERLVGAGKSKRRSACNVRLLVVVRGEAFREGNRLSRRSTGDVYPEIAALSTIKHHVLAPARAHGWEPLVVADVTVIERYKQRFDQFARGSLGAAAVRFQRLGSTQVSSLLATLTWARTISTNQHATVILRADVEIKRPLLLPHPGAGAHELMVPFRCVNWERIRYFRAAKNASLARFPITSVQLNSPCVSDTTIFIPNCRLEELLSVLRSRMRHSSMHDLCAWIDGGIRWWEPQGLFDANSFKQANPLYRQIARTEGPLRSDEWQLTHASGAPALCAYRGNLRAVRQRCAWTQARLPCD